MKRPIHAALAVALLGCNGGGDEDDRDDEDLVAGATSIVMLLNPVPNDDNTTAVPGSLGDDRLDVSVSADPGGTSFTDADGIAVVDTSPGEVELRVGDLPLDLVVEAEGDVVDVAVGWNGEEAAIFAGTPIRYAAGERSGAVFVPPGTEMADIEEILAEDNVVAVLEPGTYLGDLVIRGTGVVLFGEGFSRDAVVIDGSVDARGGNVRVRGVTITGGLSSNGNDFGASFTTVLGPTSVTGNGGTFLDNVFCGSAVVPSDAATLLDNEGLAPLDPAPSELCEDPS